MNSTPDEVPSPRKPRISYFFATACGLGYLKPGPGRVGSAGGRALMIALVAPFTERFGSVFAPVARRFPALVRGGYDEILYLEIFVALFVSLVGVWASTRVEGYLGK